MDITRRNLLFALPIVWLQACTNRLSLSKLNTKVPLTMEMLENLCNHFIPPFGNSPGAISLGIHKLVYEKAMSNEFDRKALEVLYSLLEHRGYFSLPAHGQNELIKNTLVSTEEGDTLLLKLGLTFYYQYFTALYYTREEAWPSLEYRTPQPVGYPDYEKC